jgi:hypothetical protein
VLKGLDFGAYPLGGNGGDSVILAYNFTLSTWHIVGSEVL